MPEMESIDIKDLKDIQTICMSFLAEEPPFMQEKQKWHRTATSFWVDAHSCLISGRHPFVSSYLVCVCVCVCLADGVGRATM